MPPIDWDHYRSNVREEDLRIVCTFEERYTLLEAQIPFPIDEEDNRERLECIKKDYKKDVQEFNKNSEKEIRCLEEEKDRIVKMMPFEEMTLEDFRDNCPDRAIDPINNPTFWPHTPEEQDLPEPPKPKESFKDKVLAMLGKKKKK